MPSNTTMQNLLLSNKMEIDILVKETMSCLNVAVETIGDVSTVWKLNRTLLKLDSEVKNFADFIKSTLRMLHIKAMKKNVTIDISACENQWHSNLALVFDPRKIALCIRILVDNAIKYTPIGGKVSINLRIMASEVSENNAINLNCLRYARVQDAPAIVKYLRVEVWDSGVGLEYSKIQEIFSGGHAENGMGLHVAKSLVQLHGGRIGGVSTEEEAGSLFYIDLPFGDTNLYPEGNEDLEQGGNFPLENNNLDAGNNLYVDRGCLVTTESFLGVVTASSAPDFDELFF
jgi:signal transduction histidine kinase